eukprot:2295006-Amphidinium_carterae.1
MTFSTVLANFVYTETVCSQQIRLRTRDCRSRKKSEHCVNNSVESKLRRANGSVQFCIIAISIWSLYDILVWVNLILNLSVDVRQRWTRSRVA